MAHANTTARMNPVSRMSKMMQAQKGQAKKDRFI
jgi:hypothetical protein